MTHRSRLGGIIFDCRTDDLGSAAGFWAAALGSGIQERDGQYVKLDRQGGLDAEVQMVEHESRVHVDIETDDIEAEVARLTGLGASEVQRRGDWVVMQAPTGHRFCVVPAEGHEFETQSTVWEG